MTIEQEFYNVFGIEKRKHAFLFSESDGSKEYYPPITDRILLELICINSAFGGIEIRHTYTIEELKNAMLEHTIKRYGYSLNKKKYFEQVQQLFKEYE